MLFEDSSGSGLVCSSCGFAFPPGYTEIPCPKCRGTAFRPSADSEGAAGSVAIRIGIHSSYALDHIKAAARFARMSAAIENAYDGDQLNSFWNTDRDGNRAYVVASIFAATAFLETTINELFADAVAGYESEIRKHDPECATLLARMWQLEIPRTATYPILKKYQVALALAKKELFDAGTSIYQDVYLLTTLRNYLIHAEPEDITLFTIGDIEPHKSTSRKLSEGLKGKFPINRLMENFGNPFFPAKCLGHGCAKWGVESCVKFTDEFFSRLGLKAPYDAFRDTLKAE
jgi:hypothetical protein